MLKRFSALLKALAVIAVFVILATLLAEFLLPLSEEEMRLLELIDLAAIAVLAADLVVLYLESERKKHFFRENWVLIISLFPFVQALRVLKAVRVLGAIIIGWLSKGFHLVTHSSKVMKAFRAVGVWFSKSKKKPERKGKK